MPGEPRKGLGESQLNSELYFLIAKFLSAGPCKRAAEVLRQELAENKLLPKRVDWDGNEHQRSYENLVELHRHISSDHLAKICERLGPILDKQIPTTVAGVRSLLGAGRQSLLRTHENVKRARWKSHTYSVLSHGKSLLPPHNFAQPANLSDVSRSREISGSCRPDLIAPSNLYSKVSLHKRLLGHLSAVYCVSFDRTGYYIFTGSDDHLVKIWQASDGRLLATLRGHAGEIADMAINYENTILAAGSCDKLIRVWCLKTKSPIAVLHAHTAMVTSLQFCPLVRGDNRYLVSTGGDGCVCFWQFSKLTQKFNPKPIKFIERSRAGVQMLCSSCSPGGVFLATGSSDNVIRVYCFTTAAPEKVCELEAHNDRVDSVEYSHHSDQFISGSRDGTARIWRYERQEWRNIVLNMAQKLNEEPLPVALTPDKKKEALTVTMVCWTCDDTHVVTAVSDFSLKVWDPNTGKLLTVLTGHEDEVFVLEASPSDSRILLSAGHDGHVLIWDIFREVKIKSFYNMIEGQGHGAVFDCKFSPDGLSFAATDSHGFLSMFGFGSNERHKMIPEEVFFHTDYRPLIRDANNYVLDEQTQQAPHLMPPPFLVDIDGNPYPPALQTLVPGRERCSAAQLVPQLAVNEDGEQEVVGEAVEEMEVQDVRVGVGTDEDRPEIDMMIALMQRQQDVRLAEERGVPMVEAEEPLASPPPLGSPRARSALARGIGMRRSGETEGVRQSLENVSQRATQSQLAAIKRQVVVKELEPSLIKKSEEFRHVMAEREFKKFISERKKKPHTEVVSNSASSSQQNNAGDRATVETGRNRLTTRALYDTEEEEEESSPEDGWDSDKTGGSDSSEYSDWMGDQGSNLQPPQRTSTRQRKQRKLSSSGTEDDEETEIEVDEDNDVDVEESDLQSPEKKPSPVKRPQRKKHQKREIMNNAKELKELPEEFRPPEWLTDTIPRKAPYVSQMGDQVIYFRQGHELYLKAVKNRKIYHVELNKNQPWNKFPNLREHELVKIVGIKYEIKPPRLCCLKLAVLDMVTGKPSGGTFNIKYHDMPDVIDFLVLKQNYDTAMQRKWKAGDRFRSMIDDAWWMGRIESQAPYQEEYPDSMFQSYVVHWDNGEIEKLSPWDMEPINESRLPPKVGGGVPVTQDELKSLMYTPGEGEWPECGRDLECERIISGMEAIMGHSIAEPFLTPVDLSAFPSYGVIIEYPMDLSTIKARLENHFYRRVNAVQFDVRYVESNAHRFNEPGSLIVKSARMLTETILRFIDIPESMDIMPLLTQRSRGEEFRWDRTQSDSDTEVTSSSRKGKKSKGGVRKGKAAAPPDPNAWKGECAGLLQTMVQCQDSEPFRSAVDPVDYPDYQDVIEQPMDLALVREKLEADGYGDPLEFSRDIRLMFHNSRTYNTNKRSRIYTMTLRLSAMFEDNMKEIINRWKAATKHSKHVKPDPKSRSNSAKQSKTAPVISSTNTRSCNSSGSQRIALDDPSGSHSNGNSSSSRTIINNGSSGEESSGSTTEVESCPVERKTSNLALRKSSTAAQSNGRSECKSPLTNGHTVPYTTRSSTGTRKRKKLTSSSNSSSSSSSSTNSSSSSNSDTEIEGANVSKKKKAKRKKPAPRKQPAKRPQPDSSSSDEGSSDSSSSNSDSGEDNSESGENEKEQQVRRSQRNVSRKSNSKRQQQPKRQKTLIGDDSDNDTDNEANEAGAEVIDDDTNDEDYVVSESVRNSKSRTRNTTRRSNKNSQESRESSQQNHRTRNRGQRTVHYEEDSDDESGPSDSERNHVTMSSRGRLRRLTPRARASLMGV